MLRNATTKTVRSAGRLIVCALLAAMPLRAAPAPDSVPEVIVYPVEVTMGASAVRNPAIAVSPEGRVTVVAEFGPRDAGRLAVAEFSFRGHPFVAPLALAGPGDCRRPCLTYDTSGTVHLLWEEQTSGTYAIRYAWRTTDHAWHDGGVISQTPGLDCEFPQAAWEKGSGRLWAAWHAGMGTRFGIHLAMREGGSPFALIDVPGSAGDHHNLRPQLFPDSPYLLLWYQEIETAFALRAAVFDEEKQQVQVLTPLDFDRLDARKTPELFQAPSGMLGGVWNDLVGDRNRVLVGLQDPEIRGKGLVADTTLSGEAMEPCAVAVGDWTVALAWMSREPAGSAICLGQLDGRTTIGQSLALQVSPRVAGDDAVSRPRLAAGPGRLVHCVWFSDAVYGGSGCLYYAVARY